MKLFRTANKDIIDECRSFCNFPLPTEMLEIKSNKFCKICEVLAQNIATRLTPRCIRDVLNNAVDKCGCIDRDVLRDETAGG